MACATRVIVDAQQFNEYSKQVLQSDRSLHPIKNGCKQICRCQLPDIAAGKSRLLESPRIMAKQFEPAVLSLCLLTAPGAKPTNPFIVGVLPQGKSLVVRQGVIDPVLQFQPLGMFFSQVGSAGAIGEDCDEPAEVHHAIILGVGFDLWQPGQYL